MKNTPLKQVAKSSNKKVTVKVTVDKKKSAKEALEKKNTRDAVQGKNARPIFTAKEMKERPNN